MNRVKLIIFPAVDVPSSTRFFASLLGGEPYVDSPYYVGFKAGDIEIGLVPQAMNPGVEGPLPYVDVDDINGTIAMLVAAGAKKTSEPKDVANGLLVASIKTADGSAIGLRQPPKA